MNNIEKLFNSNKVKNVLTTIFLLVLVGFSVVGIRLIFGELDETAQTELWLETTKALLQLSIIVIIGGFATWLLTTFEKERNANKARNKYYEEFLHSLQTNYQSVMLSRHELRSIGFSTHPSKTMSKEQFSEYSDQMKNITDAKLILENLNVETRNFPKAFHEGKPLRNMIELMESYLQSLLSEYEIFCPKLINRREDVLLDELTNLLDFTNEKSDARFSKYKLNHDKALGIVRQELLPMKREK